MLSLPDVTLVIIDTVCHELAAMAITECTKRVRFGDVKVFSDEDIHPATIKIKPFANVEQQENFLYQEFLGHIKTSHMLFTQYDSWVIDAEKWTDEYLKYDYIGAPWWYDDGFNVGNSGFCLRSKALSQFLVDHRDEFPIKQPEDDTLCRVYRPRLPQFKWASEALAQVFSFERVRPSIESRHFGFHGMFNWPFVLPPDQLAVRVELARKNAYIKQTDMLNELDSICRLRWLKLKGQP